MTIASISAIALNLPFEIGGPKPQFAGKPRHMEMLLVRVETSEGITHRDYVTQAWTRNPVKDMLVKMAEAQPTTRIAAGAPSAASR